MNTYLTMNRPLPTVSKTFQRFKLQKAQVNESRPSSRDPISPYVLAQDLIRVNFSVTLVTSE